MKLFNQLKFFLCELCWGDDEPERIIVPPEEREIWCGTPLLRQILKTQQRKDSSWIHLQPFEQKPVALQEQIVNIGDTFIETLEEIHEEKRKYDWSSILWLLDSVTLDDDYHLGLRFAGDNHFGDKSWFYCYQGTQDSYQEDYNKEEKEKYGKFHEFFACYSHEEIYDVFNHLKIEQTEMGAWQAYLISISSTLLPVFWHGAYFRRAFVFSAEHWKQLKLIQRYTHQPEQIHVDVSPSVKMEGNKSIVSCCYWNNWQGLVRETVPITFHDGRACFLDQPSHETLIKYNCGFRL